MLSLGWSQDRSFNQGTWQTANVDHQRIVVTMVANEERFDTAYTEDINTGEMVMVTSHLPMSRYEYFPPSSPFVSTTKLRLHRRIEIKQEPRTDTTFVEDINTGELRMVLRNVVMDIPWGAYEEYGQSDGCTYLLWQGHVEGLAPDGGIRRVGLWRRLDHNGVVLEEIEF